MDFTNEEKERINELYGNDFEGITPDDAKLIGRWEAWKATQDAKYRAEMESVKIRTDAKLEELKARSEKAMEDLRELHDKALKRLERLDDVEKK